MGKPTGDQPNPQPQEPTVSEPDKLAPASADATPAEPAKIEPPEPAKIEAATVAALPQPEPVVAIAPAATPEPAPIVATVEAPKLDSVIAEPVTPQPVDIGPADIRTDETIAPAVAPSLLSGWTTSLSLARARRLAPLAATHRDRGGARRHGRVVRDRARRPAGERAGRASRPTRGPRRSRSRASTRRSPRSRRRSTASAKSASAQLIKLGDRLDRFEKAQAEPTARLAKLAEAVDRIERRTPTSVAAAAHDITGSVTALAPAPHLEAPETRPASPPVLEGWRVRSVYNGAALIQARAGGVMEVEPGDNLPGLGRIEAIRRQDGHWVVVTSKGLILTR